MCRRRDQTKIGDEIALKMNNSCAIQSLEKYRFTLRTLNPYPYLDLLCLAHFPFRLLTLKLSTIFNIGFPITRLTVNIKGKAVGAANSG